MEISIIILTYNRKDRLEQQLRLLSDIAFASVEIIVVDNNSSERVDDLIQVDQRARMIRNSVNEGAVGRNRGIAVAKGEIVITLDDDVYGITDRHIETLIEVMSNKDIAAVNFKIQEEGAERLTDWCHPYDPDIYHQNQFETNDISEGAVAFRRQALKRVGLYPDYFFISHEGPDLALRLINAGWRVIYCPDIVVTHACEQRGRASWRRYYFDTRNQLWLVLRNLSFWYGLKRLVIGWGSMLVYSVRDGYFRYWLKGIRDSFQGAPRAWRDRIAPTSEAKCRWREIEKYKPGFWTMLRKRLFSNQVRI